MPILKVEGLVKRYGARTVVDGVDFEVEPGQIVGLLGPNGAGKTTSFRMTCGMVMPNKGKVTLQGKDVTDWPMYRRAAEGGMGYLAQESSVFRKLTVEQMRALASIAQEFGDGDIRLTVWQNLLLSGIPDARLDAAKARIEAAGLGRVRLRRAG